MNPSLAANRNSVIRRSKHVSITIPSAFPMITAVSIMLYSSAKAVQHGKLSWANSAKLPQYARQ